MAARKLNKGPGLSVTLADERFGPAGHPDSNWTKLIQAGFKVAGASLAPVLTGKDTAETAKEFGDLAEKLLRGCGYRIGLLGIGADGHIAGILPGSPAASSRDLVCGYQAPDYQRLTLTPYALEILDEVIVYAIDDSKRPALENLNKNLSITEQPAQVLKRIPAVTIYNGLKGDSYEDSN